MKYWKQLSRRGLALFLAVLLCVGVMNLTAFAAGNTAAGGVLDFVKTADPATQTHVMSSSEAGMVWTDKSVAEADGKNFDVTFSTLSAAKQITQTTSDAVDVMLVLDLSDSMTSRDAAGGKRRIDAMVGAVNGFLDTLVNNVGGGHQNTRVGITTFTYDAQIILPLGHYASAKLSCSGNTVTATANGRNTGSDKVEVGTNIQAGLYQAMATLGGMTNGTPFAANTPYVILLSDGQPAHANGTAAAMDAGVGYVGPHQGAGDMWWVGSLPMLTNEQSTVSDSDVISLMKALLTASYYKQVLTGVYGKDVNIFTIGMAFDKLANIPTYNAVLDTVYSRRGPTFRELAEVMMAPNLDNSGSLSLETMEQISNEAEYRIQRAWNAYRREFTTNGERVGDNFNVMLSVPGTNRHGQLNYVIVPPYDSVFGLHGEQNITTLNYVDKFYEVSATGDLNGIFADITQQMQIKAAPVIENSDGDGYLVYTDVLGDYMEFKGIIKATYSNQGVSAVDNRNGMVEGTLNLAGSVNSGVSETAVDLSRVIVEIGKNSDGRQTVTIKVPADTVPTTVFAYNNDKLVQTNHRAPLQITYRVGLKDGIEKGTFEGVSEDYIRANTNSDLETVSFYSNDFEKGEKKGTATVTFTPAAGNSYYTSYMPKTTAKGANTTGTASNVSYTAVSDGRVTTWLGNNGKLDLSLGKTADFSFTKKAEDTGKALAGAEFTLTATDVSGSVVKRVATSGADGTVTFKDIPSGFTYTLAETKAPENYEAIQGSWTVVVKDGKIVNVTAKGGAPGLSNGGEVADPRSEGTRTLTITKTWFAPADLIPESLAVTVKQTNGNWSRNVTLTKGNNWTATIVVPDYNTSEKSPFEYSVEEVLPAGFQLDASKSTLTGDTLTLTNVATGKTSVTVRKDWILPDGAQAPTGDVGVAVALLTNGQESGKTVTLSADNGWTGVFENLDKYDANGQVINYAVVETVPSGYRQVGSPTGSGTISDPFVITNTVNDTRVEISGEKTWNFPNGVTAEKPAVTIELLQDGEIIATAELAGMPDAAEPAEGEEPSGQLPEGEAWTYRFADLPKYEFIKADGEITAVHEYVYTVREANVPDGFTSSVANFDVTNTYVGETSVTVNKVWVDLEGTAHDAVKVQLLKNGVEEGEPKEVSDSAVWENLPKYDTTGALINYTVQEVEVPEGYTPNVEADGEYVFTITNTRDIDDDTITISGSKIWQHPGDTDTPEITITLYKDVNGEKVEVDAQTLTDGNTQYSFTVPKYRYETVVTEPAWDEEVINPETGEVEETIYHEAETQEVVAEIDYTVEESGAPAYYVSTSRLNGTNGVDFINTITGTVDVSVEKVWKDAGAANRPAAVITLYRVSNGDAEAVEGAVWTTTEDGAKTWSGLPQYDGLGNRYVYFVQESVVANYSAAYSGTADVKAGIFKYTITNTPAVTTTSVIVTKNWIDGSSAQETRPESITVNLYQEGYIDDEGNAVPFRTAELTAENAVEAAPNTWSYTFTDLPVYSEDFSKVHVYTVDEEAVEGYDTAVNGTTITNTLEQETIDLPITKYWVAPAGTEFPEITFEIAGSDGKAYTLTASAEGAALDGNALENCLAVSEDGKVWTISVPLDKYGADRNPITYTVTEQPVEGYDSEKLEDTTPNTFRNTIQQASYNETGMFTATKEWVCEDGDRYKHGMPESILVGLYQNGQLMDGRAVTVQPDENSVWSVTFEGLEKYSLTTGEPWVYTARELVEAKGGYQSIAQDGTVSFGGKSINYDEGDFRFVTYDYTVTYEDTVGSTVITNTYTPPEDYSYQVEARYALYLSGQQVLAASRVVKSETMAESGEVRVDPNDYTGFTYTDEEGHTVSYVFRYLNAADGNGQPLEGEEPTITVERINHTYRIVLNYELRLWKLNVQYQFTDGSSHAGFEDYKDPGQYMEGQTYTTEDKAAPSGYRLVSVMPAASGQMPGSDLTVVYIYEPYTPSRPDPVDPVDPGDDDDDDDDDPYVPPVRQPDEEIPEVTPPLDETPVVDIPEEETPLIDHPTEEVEVPEEEVPLAEVPATGDSARGVLWTAMTAVSLTGLVFLGSRKKKEEA